MVGRLILGIERASMNELLHLLRQIKPIEVVLEIENGLGCAEISPTQRGMCFPDEKKMIFKLWHT
jgi:hypothetical protein